MSIIEIIERLEKFQGKDKHVGLENRNFVRLVYPPDKRPVLNIEKYKVEVVDISERGMRLFNCMQHNLNQNIQGTVLFQSGISIEIQGKVVWQYKNELGLLANPIPRFIIEEEAYNVLRYFQEKDRKLY